VEAAYSDEPTKLQLTQVVPLPNRDIDWLPMTAAMLRNMQVWGEDQSLKAWIHNCRLDGFSRIVHGVDKNDMQKMQVLGRLKNAAGPAMQKLLTYIHGLKAAGQL
jgi:hypothetical protein